MRQRGEGVGKRAKTRRKAKGLGDGVDRPQWRPGRWGDSARRNFLEILAGDRLGGGKQPQHERADDAGASGGPFREIGQRAKHRGEMPELLAVVRV